MYKIVLSCAQLRSAALTHLQLLLQVQAYLHLQPRLAAVALVRGGRPHGFLHSIPPPIHQPSHLPHAAVTPVSRTCHARVTVTAGATIPSRVCPALARSDEPTSVVLQQQVQWSCLEARVSRARVLHAAGALLASQVTGASFQVSARMTSSWRGATSTRSPLLGAHLVSKALSLPLSPDRGGVVL